jgi:ABC-type sugar transport system substrate-binding protein
MTEKQTRLRRRLVGAGVVAVVAGATLTATVASNASSLPSASASPKLVATSAAAAKAIPYAGPEANLPVGYPKPTKKPGYHFTIGFPIPSAAVPQLAAEEAGAKAATQALGGKFISLDANFSVQQQVTDFQQLLNDHAGAIVLSALDPDSLAPVLKQAKSKGVPVFVNDVPDVAGTSTVGDGFAGDVLSGTDTGSYQKAKAAAKVAPGASFAIVGVSIPSPFLQYIASSQKAWAQRFGLKYAGELLASADSVDAGLTTGGELLAKYPQVKVVFTVTDSLAEGTASAAATAQRHVDILSMGGYASTIAQIKQGKIYATWGVDSFAVGESWVYGAYDKLTKQHLPLAAQVLAPGGKLLTKGNTGGFKAIAG